MLLFQRAFSSNDLYIGIGADPEFFLGEGALLLHGVTDWDMMCQTTFFAVFNINSSTSSHVLPRHQYTTQLFCRNTVVSESHSHLFFSDNNMMVFVKIMCVLVLYIFRYQYMSSEMMVVITSSVHQLLQDTTLSLRLVQYKFLERDLLTTQGCH